MFFEIIFRRTFDSRIVFSGWGMFFDSKITFLVSFIECILCWATPLGWSSYQAHRHYDDPKEAIRHIPRGNYSTYFVYVYIRRTFLPHVVTQIIYSGKEENAKIPTSPKTNWYETKKVHHSEKKYFLEKNWMIHN